MLGAAVVGLLAGVIALGVRVPHEPWPPPPPMWGVFGGMFAVVFAWGTIGPEGSAFM